MQAKRARSPWRDPRQMCVICSIVLDLVEIAQMDLREGRFDDVGEALDRIRVNITGDRV
jgi:hypothetical protein